ncbi:MAG: hypothetical protein PHR20_02225 [Bacteroidales bacterium]|nr:hypothetical protein [Bacteroidales bacterium]
MKGILLDDNGDIDFTGSDFAIGDDRLQSAQIILKAMPGEIKESPTLGVGIVKELKAPEDPFLRQRIKKNMALGNIGVTSVNINTTDNNIEIILRDEDN